MEIVVAQVRALQREALAANQVIQFLKPHGALYNQAHRDPIVAAGVVRAAKTLELPILGLPGGCVETLAKASEVAFFSEGFADRRYTPEGRLVPRTEPGAVLEDPREIARQAVALADRGIATLCIHGDNPHSLAIADRVIKALQAADVSLRGFLS